MTGSPVARQRRHTLHFLREIRGFSPVFLDTQVRMDAVRHHRATARARGQRYSIVTYVLHSTALVLSKHPEANAAITGRWRPRVQHHAGVHAKVAFDKTLDGRRVVLAAVLPDLNTASLDDIQRLLNHYRDGDPDHMPEFDGVRALQRLPVPLGSLAFRGTVRPLHRRAERLGTVAVTSLGHSSVDSFHSVGGTTVTLGLGRVLEQPVAVDGRVEVAPVMRLSLAFDHRVIDGAEAADVLTEIKETLEGIAV
ncbi:2-oxo acid dehydrogenase subunit E2 [Actinoplanes sp. N902-109]|uniref:2-oxo acid dehydrogenase subunit E2 n=1 Tax=Actinoplanes sp. (strain N902-109) TaxID=649831 RepID=UPI00032949D8|nr:2-oxo acid dehydrogenase subunit E2 [Actinoplanes sp. N902-109]AGL15971.1 putative 2-oxoacid dehydrogenases acyltransferase [Actinoplanes sp. N902-109]